MPIVLTKRLVKGTRLTSADFDGNMTAIEGAIADLEAASLSTERVVDLRDFAGVDLAGNNDSTSAVNAALMQAYSAGYPCRAPAGAIRVNTVRWPTSTHFFGAGTAHTRIVSDGSNAPVISSKNWYAADNHPIGGRARLAHMRIVGSNDQTRSAQHGLRFRDYWSELVDLEFENIGGSALLFTHANDAGAATTGTLVDNEIRDVRIHNCRSLNAVIIGAQDNPCYTDGVIRGLRVWTYRTGGNAGYTQLYIGHAAGWRISDVHCFSFGASAATPATCLHLHRPWHARLSRLYLENFTTSGLYMAANTGVTYLEGLTARLDDANVGAQAVYFDRPGPGQTPELHAQGVLCTKDSGANPAFGITADNAVTVSVLGPPSCAGAQSASFTPYRKINGGIVRVPNATGGWASV